MMCPSAPGGSGLTGSFITPACCWASTSVGASSAALSSALETLADLGVVELDVAEPGTDESGSGLTVTLSRLGVWGIHRRLRAEGWHVPVLGGGARGDAAALLATLASCD